MKSGLVVSRCVPHRRERYTDQMNNGNTCQDHTDGNGTLIRWTTGTPVKSTQTGTVRRSDEQREHLSRSLTSRWPTVKWSYLKVSLTHRATLCTIWPFTNHTHTYIHTPTYVPQPQYKHHTSQHTHPYTHMHTRTQTNHPHINIHILHIFTNTHIFYIFVENTEQSVVSQKCSRVGDSIPHFFQGKDTSGNKQCPRGAVGWETRWYRTGLKNIHYGNFANSSDTCSLTLPVCQFVFESFGLVLVWSIHHFFC